MYSTYAWIFFTFHENFQRVISFSFSHFYSSFVKLEIVKHDFTILYETNMNVINFRKSFTFHVFTIFTVVCKIVKGV